jgi:hypothetical protein
VTTDEKIFFYIINEETLKPTLENVMYNYMGCSSLMFGSKVRYGITFKVKQKGFNLYRRMFEHDY